ncbi:RNA polymerase sigma factor [Mariniphaga sediminis]|uniref:RNA polymerase sigma factor n=1 Tax=Mariniphaga sediminis TaxID=1628158 RepID=UPI0035690E70
MVTQNKNLTQWVETYTGDLYSWAFHKLPNVELAQDLVQDTFLAATEKIESFKGKSSPKTWLFSILNHKIIDYYRKKVNQTVPHENKSLTRFFEPEGSWKENRRPGRWYDNDDENLLDNHDFRAILKKYLFTFTPTLIQ